MPRLATIRPRRRRSGLRARPPKGKKLAGLVRRRREEAVLLEHGLYTGVQPSPVDALAALSRKRYKLREMFVSPTCGALAAGYLTESTLYYVRVIGFDVHPNDQVATNAAAFCLGASAMWLTDIMLELLVRWVKGPVPADR